MENKILNEELEEVSGGTGKEIEQLIEMIKYAGYTDFGNTFYGMDSVDRELALVRFLNEHGLGSYGFQLREKSNNRYSVGKTFISHEEFMNGVGKKLGLSDSDISMFLN